MLTPFSIVMCHMCFSSVNLILLWTCTRTVPESSSGIELWIGSMCKCSVMLVQNLYLSLNELVYASIRGLSRTTALLQHLPLWYCNYWEQNISPNPVNGNTVISLTWLPPSSHGIFAINLDPWATIFLAMFSKSFQYHQ